MRKFSHYMRARIRRCYFKNAAQFAEPPQAVLLVVPYKAFAFSGCDAPGKP